MKSDTNTALIFKGIGLVVAIAVFGFLAYRFDKWWIALFSLLFTFSYSENRTIKENTEEDKQNDD